MIKGIIFISCLGVCFIMLLVILSLELSIIYRTNMRSKGKWEKPKKYMRRRIDGRWKWFTEEEVKPEIIKYNNNFYSFNYKFLNKIL